MENKFNIYEVAKKYNMPVILEGDYIDLQTRAKSHLYLFEDGTVEGRYNYKGNVFNNAETIDDVIKNLAFEFEGYLHGRTFYNVDWGLLYEKVVGGWDKVQEGLIW